MVEADTYVVWDQFNTEGPEANALFPFCLQRFSGTQATRSESVLESVKLDLWYTMTNSRLLKADTNAAIP